MTASQDRRSVQQLRELEAKATPGPWDERLAFWATDTQEWVAITEADYLLIVAMRNALPALLDAAEALRRIANLEDSLDGHGVGGEADFAAEMLARIEGVTEA